MPSRAAGSRMRDSTKSLSFRGSPATYICVVKRSNPRPGEREVDVRCPSRIGDGPNGAKAIKSFSVGNDRAYTLEIRIGDATIERMVVAAQRRIADFDTRPKSPGRCYPKSARRHA